MGRKLEGCAPFWKGELGPHLAQCGLGWGLPPYKWHLDASSRLVTIEMGRKLGASAILHLLCICLDHLRWVFGGIYNCSKFGWNRCVSFDNVQIFDNKFGLKMRIRAPNGGF